MILKPKLVSLKMFAIKIKQQQKGNTLRHVPGMLVP